MSVWSSVPQTRNAFVYEYEYEDGFADEECVRLMREDENLHQFLDVATTPGGPLIRLCVGDHTFTLDPINAAALRDGLDHALEVYQKFYSPGKDSFF